MRRFFCALLFCAPLIAKPASLQPGTAYDFIAKDGQHVYDAVLMRETQKAYLVKAAGFGDELIAIEKDILAEPPRQIIPGKPRPKRGPSEKWTTVLTGDLRMAVGDLAAYTRFFPGFSAYMTRTMPRIPYLRTNALWASLQYSPIVSSPRRIDMFTLALGPRWNFRIKKFKGVGFFAAAAPTVSFLSYRSFSFDATSFNAGAVGVFGADWSFSKDWFLTAALAMQYIYDSGTFVLVPALSLGVGYAW